MLRTNATTLSRSVPLYSPAGMIPLDRLPLTTWFRMRSSLRPPPASLGPMLRSVPPFAWHPSHLPSNSVLPTTASPVPVAAGVDVLSVAAGVDVLGVVAGGVEDVVLSPPHPLPNAASALTRAITIPRRNFDMSHPLLGGR